MPKKRAREETETRQSKAAEVEVKKPDEEVRNDEQQKRRSGPNIDYYDSSDEEDLRNTIGNIPVQWYAEYGHVGYSLAGERIPKAEGSGGAKAKGEIDAFLQREEDPDYWRKVFDQQTGEEVALTDEQVQKLEAIAGSRYPQIGYNPYEPFFDLFSSQREIHPISNRPPDKRSFIPSLDERRIVSRMVHAIKMGWMKRRDQLEEEAKARELAEENPAVYDLWADEDSEQSKSKSELARLKMHWPAPKVPLPGHAESYRPPPEYLFSDEERRKWEETEPERRRLDFIPQRFDALRKVPFYERFYEDRLERCMDLHLAPRQRRQRLNVDASQLLPDLPNPKDLQPFPTTLAFYMRGHLGQVRWLSVEPECGELLVSGGADCTVRVWMLPSGYCLRQFRMPAPVTCVQFCPDPAKTLVLVSCECDVLTVLNISSGDRLTVSKTSNFLASLPVEEAPENTAGIKWFRGTVKEEKKRTDKRQKPVETVQLQMKDNIRNVAWHRKGDYFATVGFQQTASTVLIHQLSKCNSQKPFTKRKGIVQSVLFHPSKPWFFVGTRQHVFLYDLAKTELKRKLLIGTQWLSCMALHPGGDNLFIGALDRTFAWFDLDFGTKPWKKLRNHQSAIRSICYHRKYPLLATVSDDATAIVYHARVSQELMRDNELVPVKRLFGHKFLAQRELIRLKQEVKMAASNAVGTAENEDEKIEDAKEVGAEKTTQNQHDVDSADDDDNDEQSDAQKRAKAIASGELSKDRLAILCAVFHPAQPWLLTSGADGQIALFSY